MTKEIKTDNVYNLDQFFTKSTVAKYCINELKKYFKFEDFDLIIEPSAGTGSFYYNLPVDKRVGIELDNKLCEENFCFNNMSFFDYYPFTNGKIMVIGNPPFGTQNKLSVNFFNHAAKFSDVISFIIPKSWNKNAIKNRLDKNFHLVKSIDLVNDCFEGEKNTKVKCCFQIWQKLAIERKKIINAIIHRDWMFLSPYKENGILIPPKDVDFIILAYGSNSGRISEDIFRWKPKSIHFIKANIDKDILISRFKSLDFGLSNNSARQSSLCKEDLVKLYSEKFGD
jgi:predicted RNA methylase